MNSNTVFLALLDRHLDDQVAAVDRLVAGTSDIDLRAGLEDASAAAQDGSFGMLMLEFWLYAARDAQAKAALAERYARMRNRLADVIAEWDAAREVADARDPGQVAALVLALDAGLFLQHLIDPTAVTPELRVSALAAAIDPSYGTRRPASD